MINRRSGRRRLVLVAFVALSIIIITLDFRQGEGGPFQRAKDISAAIIAPIQEGFTAVARPVGDFFSSLAELSNIRGENRELEAENKDLGSKIEQAQATLDENERLRELLGLQESWTSMDTVAAEVIGEVSSNFKWAVQIDKGRKDGIRKDMAVINREGLVGKIVQVSNRFSTVLLMIDPEASARVRVGDTRDRGNITGNGSGEPLSLEFIGPNADVTTGDVVTTAGYDLGIFPPGIPVGEVSEVGVKSAAVDKDIVLAPLVNFNTLDFVLVLLESGPRLNLDKEVTAGEQ